MEIRSSKTKLFLIELIIIILFFSVACVVCVNIFADAKVMNVKSVDETYALLESQDAAEIIKQGGMEAFEDYFHATDKDGVYSVYYDGEWQPTDDASDAVYVMEVTPEQQDGMFSCDIAVKKSGETVHELNVKHYTGEEGAV